MFCLEAFTLDYWEKNKNWKSTIIWRNNWCYIIWRSRITRLIECLVQKFLLASPFSNELKMSWQWQKRNSEACRNDLKKMLKTEPMGHAVFESHSEEVSFLHKKPILKKFSLGQLPVKGSVGFVAHWAEIFSEEGPFQYSCIFTRNSYNFHSFIVMLLQYYRIHCKYIDCRKDNFSLCFISHVLSMHF
jgi:hypothetical protein